MHSFVIHAKDTSSRLVHYDVFWRDVDVKILTWWRHKLRYKTPFSQMAKSAHIHHFREFKKILNTNI